MSGPHRFAKSRGTLDISRVDFKTRPTPQPPSPAPLRGLQLMIVIVVVVAIVALFANIQRARRTVETVTVTRILPPSAIPSRTVR